METKTQTSETLLARSVEGMTKSKVDMDTSDIFFNFGTPAANRYIDFCNQTGIEYKDSRYQEYLLEDAQNFLDIVVREGITPQDLVDDFLERI